MQDVMKLMCAAAALVCANASTAWATVTNPPNVVGGMIHGAISFDASDQLVFELEPGAGSSGVIAGDTPANPIELLRFPGEVYDGAASVLNEVYYSDRLGFLPNSAVPQGFGAGDSIVISVDSITPGLRLYEGGMRMMRANHSYTLIFDEAGDAWTFGGLMSHPWVAADTLGDYSVTFTASHIDSTGGVGAFGSDSITVYYRAVPTPGAAGALLVAGLLVGGRRRERAANR